MKSNLLKVIKKYGCLKTLFSRKKVRGFYVSTSPVLGIFALTIIINSLVVYKFYSEKQDLDLARSLIDKLALRVRKGALNKQKEVDYFGSLEASLPTPIYSPVLQKEKKALESFDTDSALKGNFLISSRLKHFKTNQLKPRVLEEKKSSKLIETIFDFEKPLDMDGEDLKKFLVSIEQSVSPKRLFKQFHLEKRAFSQDYETFEVQATILERKKPSIK